MGENNICLLSVGVKIVKCSYVRIRISVQQTERLRSHKSVYNGITAYSKLVQSGKSVSVPIVAETPLLS